MENEVKRAPREELLFESGISLGMAGNRTAVDDYKQKAIDATVAFQQESTNGVNIVTVHVNEVINTFLGMKEKVHLGKDKHVQDLVSTFNELGKLFTPATQADPVLLSAANEFRDKFIEQYRKNNVALFNMEDEINKGIEKLDNIFNDVTSTINNDKSAFLKKIAQIENDYNIINEGYLFGVAYVEALSNNKVTENA